MAVERWIKSVAFWRCVVVLSYGRLKVKHFEALFELGCSGCKVVGWMVVGGSR